MEPGQVTALLARLAAAPVAEGLQLAGPNPGDEVGRFHLGRRIGQGGFGVVFEAHDGKLNRAVAVKLVRAGHRVAPGSERLLAEAEAAARLSHPNIVSLHDVGHCDWGPFLVQELLRGESLAERLERGQVPLGEAVRIAGEIARALAHAHQLGVVHRDLKPANVFLCDDGQVKVLDFGMAHAFGLPRLHGGTPAFMAPEQRTGAPEDERTDVHALGVTLYQLLTGELPFGEDGTLRRPLPAPRLAIDEAPELAELVHRMLERDPVRRPRNGAEVSEALARIAPSLPATPAGPSRPVRRRRRWPLVLAGVCAGIAAALVIRWIWPGAAPPTGDGTTRLLLAVADVANETGEKELELSGLLRTVLEQSTFLEVLPRGRLVDALPEHQAEGLVRLEERATRTAARAIGARFVLLANLLRLGQTYVLEVRAIDPATGTPRFSFKEQDRGKDALPGLLDRAGEKVRLLLGEEPAEIRKSTIPTGMVTSSLEAWRAYSKAMDCFQLHFFVGSFGECLAGMEEAVAIDRGFALAHLQLSVLRLLEGRPLALQQDAVRNAQAHADRVPPHDRQRLEGWAAYLDGRDMEAKKLLRESAEASPDDKFAWYLAGEVPYHRDEIAEALPLHRHTHELNPNWFDATQHLVFALGVTGDEDGLRALAARLGAPGRAAGALAGACQAMLWLDPPRAVPLCERANAAPGKPYDGQVAIALLNADRRDALQAHLEGMWRRESAGRKPADSPGFAWYMRLWLLAQAGRWQEAGRVAGGEADHADAWFHSTLAEIVAGSGDAAAVHREALRILELDRMGGSNLAVHLAYLGDLRRAAEFERYLPPGSPRVEAYRAVVLWRTGDLPGAIAILRPLASSVPMGASPEIPPPLYLLGEALSESGQDAEAVAVLRRYQRIPVLTPTWFRPRSQWFLARSLDRLGDRDGARAALGPLLKLWANADAMQPHLAEARALGQRLGVH